MDIFLDNSNVVELRALTNSVTQVVDTGATVSVTIIDSCGDEVAGETWPVSMSHDSGGTYRATLADSLELLPGRRYRAVVSATGSGSESGRWTCPVIAAVRACD